MALALPSCHTRLAVLLLPVLVVLAVLTPCTPADALPRGSSTRPTDGVWPLQPRPEVVDRFDAPDTRWGPGHRGVDLRGTVGEAVHAAEAGTVTFAGRIAGRGVVVVDHGGTRTTYEPVDASVSVGDAVVAGAVVGRLTLAGSHCFPAACLHWGLIAGSSTYRDPLTLVGGGPVRLLPLSGPLPGGPVGLLPLTAPLPGGPVGLLPLTAPLPGGPGGLVGGPGGLPPLTAPPPGGPAGRGRRDAWPTGVTPSTRALAPMSLRVAFRSLPRPAGTPGPAGNAAAFRAPLT